MFSHLGFCKNFSLGHCLLLQLIMEFLDIFCRRIFSKISKNLINVLKKNVPPKSPKKIFFRKNSIVLFSLVVFQTNLSSQVLSFTLNFIFLEKN